MAEKKSDTSRMSSTPAKKATAAKKSAAKKPAAKKPAAKKPAAATTTAGRKPAAAKTTAVRKPAAAKTTAVRKPAVTKTTAKAAAPKMTAAAAARAKAKAERGAPARVPGRKERRGVVVSASMQKTMVVRIDSVKAHDRYGKVVRRSTRLHVHDEREAAQVGDLVRVVETRPLSATKRWRLLDVLVRAK